MIFSILTFLSVLTLILVLFILFQMRSIKSNSGAKQIQELVRNEFRENRKEIVEVQCTPEMGGVWLSSDAVACGVQLTSTTQGRFENNGFIMLPGQRYWIGCQSSDGDEVVPQQVKVAHLGMYADAR